MDKKQQRLEFGRAEKLNLLEHLDLPNIKGTSRSAMCAVLKAIDAKCRNHARFTIAWAELAQMTNLGKNSVIRAAKQLANLNLLIVHERKNYGWHANALQIVWSNLQDCRVVDNLFFCPEDRIPTAAIRVPTAAVRIPTAGIPRNRPRTDQEAQRRGGAEIEPAEPIAPTVDQRAEGERLARKVDQCIGRAHTEDLELSGKLGLLVALGHLAPATVHDSIEAVQRKRPRNRAAYLQTCIGNQLNPGETLNGLLAIIPDSQGPRTCKQPTYL